MMENQAKFNNDEIRQVGRGFEIMRGRLAESHDLLLHLNTELEEKISKRTRQLQGLLSATHHLTSTTSLESALDAIIEESRQLFGADRCAVYVESQDTGELKCLARRGLSEAYVNLVCQNYRQMAGGAVHTIPKPVIVADAWTDPRMALAAEQIRREGFRSILILPFIYQGDATGAFGLYHDQQHNYSEEDLSIGEAFARQAAIAIQNTRLYTQTQRTCDYYASLLDSLHDEIIVVDRNYVITDVNGPFARKTGCTREHSIGQHCYTVSHHLDFPCWQSPGVPCPVAEVWQTGRASRVIHKHYDASGKASYFDIAASPLFDENGHLIGAIEAYRDVSVEKQLEERLKAIYQLGEELILLRDMDVIMQRVLEIAVNVLGFEMAACGMVDTTAGELVYCCEIGTATYLQGQRFRLDGEIGVGVAVVHSGSAINVPDTLQDPRSAALTSSARSKLCVPMRVGERVIGVLNGESVELNRFSVADQELLQTLADQAAIAIENARLYKDVQEQMCALKESQVRLVQSEKLAAIGELVAGVAHELNNPLTAIILYAQLLRRNDVGENVKHEFLDNMVAETHRAAKIVRNLLDFARQRQPEYKPVQINDVLNSTLDLLAYELRTHNIEWTTRFSHHLPLTIADPHHLQQVFVNLINNAQQAMRFAEREGHLTIITELGPSRFMSQDKGVPVIRITFADNGPGIPSNVLPRIFDPFYTTKPEGEGTGLGLSVCHGIISKHQGYIWAESQLGKGASFFIELPIVAQEPSLQTFSETPFSSQPAHSGAARPILIVDDEKSVLEIVGQALRRSGYYVDTAASGEAALACLAQSQYDLIICDLFMPGMSGSEFYRQMRTQYPDAAEPFIFTTGDVVTPSIQRLLEESGASFLAKPFDLDKLIATVEAALTEPTLSTPMQSTPS